MRNVPQPLLLRGLCKVCLCWSLVAGVWLAADLLAPRLIRPPPLSVGYPSSVAVHDRAGKLLRLTLSGDEAYRKWVPLRAVAPRMVQVTLLYEDRRFYWHPGVNPLALVRAAFSTYVGGGRRVGGSTVSMQLARRLYRVRSSTVPGKLRQVARALQLELLYSKDELLEAYLNLLPMGRNIEGVEAASLIYFGKPASQLQLREAMTLAVIPQHPGRRAPRPGRLNPHLQRARAALTRAWRARHAGAVGELASLQLPVPVRAMSDLPFEAPHLVNRVLAQAGPPRRETTLDLGLQRALERHLRAYVARHRRLGLRNAAALLLDRRDMGLRAVVGSVDFFDHAISGQVDGTRARRSPGSTLKPLIYALGLEQGLIHPLTVLTDTPLAMAGFRPENADRGFAGPLTAVDALNRSRNIPALALAARLRQPDLYGFLRDAGVALPRSRQHYGLALALGGAELTMEQLVSLYAVLGNRGELRPVRLLRAQPRQPGRRLLSAQAAFVTLRMLAQNPRPHSHRLVRSVDDARQVYWKTGTSNGHRDAWTVGLVGPYVLAVWLGNFSGAANPVLRGRAVAAPLFFEIVDSLRARRLLNTEAPPRPAGVRRVKVCAASGRLPGPRCPHQVKTMFIPGRSPIAGCRVHREVLLDARTGLRACPGYKGPTRAAVYELWPSDVLHQFRLAGVPRRTPPPWQPGCQPALAAAADQGLAPRITSPQAHVVYAATGPSRQLTLQAVTDASARQLFWFVNARFVGRQAAGKPLLWRPQPGQYVVRVVDDLGRSDSRKLKVELM